MSHKVKEEISFWHADDLVGDFDEEAEALRGLQEQPVGDVLAEVLGFCAGFHLKCLIGIIREVNLVENLGRFVLNGFHFYQMGWVFPGSIPQGFLESLNAVCCQGVMFPGLQEPLDMGQEDVTWREKACTQPQQLPAFLFTVSVQEEIQEGENHSWHGHFRSALCNTV